MFCHKCGNQQPEDAAFCEKCGAKLIADNAQAHKPAQQTPSQKIVSPVKPKKKSIFKIILIVFGAFIALLVLLLIIGAIMQAVTGEEGATRIAVESSPESNSAVEEEMPNVETSSNTKTLHQDEILYNGLAVIQFFNESMIQDVLGEPLKVEEYPASYELHYADMRFVISGTGVRSIVCDNPGSFEANEASLDTTRAELTKIFGDPAEEGWNEWNEELYEVIYNFNDYDLTFNFDSLDGTVDYFYFVATGDFSNDYYPENTNLDPELIGGRWVSDIGYRLQLFDDGTVTTNLDTWELAYGFPDSDRDITWEASDGKLALTAHVIRQYEYTVDGEYLKLEGIPGEYHRREGTGTVGLYGIWMPVQGGGGGIALYEDGTGENQISHMGSCTWSADGEVLTFFFNSIRTYDYIVQGDHLTLYGRNGSVVYTRVGG